MGNEICRLQNALPPVERGTDPNFVEDPLDDKRFNFGVTTTEDIQEQRRLAVQKKRRWSDDSFPATDESLYVHSKWQVWKWLRPHHISNNPELFKNGVCTDDVIQGDLGNCWWLSAVAAIATRPQFIEWLIPEGKTLTQSNKVGMVHFRFWRFGSWVDVSVDDRLPLKSTGELVMGRSVEDEYWLPLMEKAYAKLHGSYEALEGGFTQDALEDLTGGIAVPFELGLNTPRHMFKYLEIELQHGSFACCSTSGGEESESELTGLVSGHAYTVIAAKSISLESGTCNLVRIRNPWGNKVEWKGKWADKSEEWSKVSDEVRKSLHDNKPEGKWCMEFDDFKKHFETLTICATGRDSQSAGAPNGTRWFLLETKGTWKKESSAGGSINDMDKYKRNPQYLLRLEKPDEQNGKCPVVIGLMQEYRRLRKNDVSETLHLGISVYKVNEKPRGKLMPDYFQRNREHVSSGDYVDKREVNITAELDPGYYVVIPSTFHPDKSGSFLLRVFTQKKSSLKELD